jgi:hypothetical protein
MSATAFKLSSPAPYLTEPQVNDIELNKLFGNKDNQLRPQLKKVSANIRESMHELGNVLAGYKAICKHGEWIPFLNVLGIKERSAQRYVEIASLQSELDELGLSETLKLSSGHDVKSEHSLKVAKKVLELVNTPDGALLDNASLIEQAIKAAKPKLTFVQSTPTDDAETIRLRTIEMWGERLDEDLSNLRDAYENDKQFRKDVLSRLEACLNG